MDLSVKVKACWCSEDYFQPVIIDDFAAEAAPVGANQSDAKRG